MFDAIKDRIEFIKITAQNLDVFGFPSEELDDEPLPPASDTPPKEPKPSLFEKFLERWCFVNYCDEEGVERFDQPISPPSDTNAPSH